MKLYYIHKIRHGCFKLIRLYLNYRTLGRSCTVWYISGERWITFQNNLNIYVTCIFYVVSFEF